MAASSIVTDESVNFLYRAMVERDPRKRRVKPVDRNMMQLNFADLDDSSDDSDFKVNDHDDGDSDSSESKADDDDSDDESDSKGESNEDDGEKNGGDSTEESKSDGSFTRNRRNGGLTLAELIEQARVKQAQARQRIASTGSKGDQLRVLICAVCLGDISEEDDEIVECDGCGVSVHEGCYGIGDAETVDSTASSSSTEPWFCEACRAGNKNPMCELCPNLGGIFKETDVGKWVHLVCALYIPGVAFGDVDKLSSVTLFEMPYSKWGAKACVLCEDERFTRTGICISCDAGLCKNTFHATCAQKEGLLSEASPEEDIADPFFAYCKLHADKSIVRSKRRNWLALQSQIKQRQENANVNTDEQVRINRKLRRYRVKYLEAKENKTTPWVPTQKMPRMLTSSPSACRKLLRKAELMGISTQAFPVGPLRFEQLLDIRKKWHIPPAFSLEFISYYLDRISRMQGMQDKLDKLLKDNSNLQNEEQMLRMRYDELVAENESMKAVHSNLHEKGTKLWTILDAIGTKKFALPDILRIKKVIRSPTKHGKRTDHYSCVQLNKCGICKATNDQHLLAKCDTCNLMYHLGCLDPPLSRMPKKTKLQGWQCSECDKTDDDNNEDAVDPNAPRRLREHIKEPVKFTPPASNDGSNSSSAANNGTANDNVTAATPRKTARSVKRRSLVVRRINKSMSQQQAASPAKRQRLDKTETPQAEVVKEQKSAKRKRVKGRRKRVREITATPISTVTVKKEKETTPAEIPLKKSPRLTASPKVVKSDQRRECCRCNKPGTNTSFVRCDQCLKSFHWACLDPPMKKSPKQRGYLWHCEDCDPTTEDEGVLKAEKTCKVIVKKLRKEDKPKETTATAVTATTPSPPKKKRKRSRD